MKFDSISVIECMKGAEDEEIIRMAIKENRVIITNDKEFGRLAIFYKPPGLKNQYVEDAYASLIRKRQVRRANV